MRINSAQEMFDFGQKIGSECRAGDLILINGPLGAGKTVLVQGIGAALGFSDVTSPTFVISRVHKGPLPLIHVDAYRLLESGSANAFIDDLDLDSVRESGVTVIEWGGAESARLSDERLEIEIDRSQEARVVSITKIGKRWESYPV
jgi:tRNA threonylcarbamoyladenosine biosynthesis protein TsaE